jgi:uncharacterized membrane protein YhaH (DUF805 family)
VASPPSIRLRNPLLWVLFGLAGRVSRGIYWMCFLVFVCLESALLAQMLGQEQASYHDLVRTILPGALLLTLYCNIAVAVKRLHDLGYSGFLALALLVPVVNLAFTIWVGILPGTAGPNRFGAAPDLPPP